MSWLYLFGFLMAYGLSAVGVPIAAAAAKRFGLVDVPDGNLKDHAKPTPYLGGLAIFVSFLLSMGMITTFDREVLAILLAGTIAATLGLLDDFGAVTPQTKVLGLLVAVFVLVKAGVVVKLVFLPSWLRPVVTALWLVGVANAFNITDIMDGLAGGLAVIASIYLLAVAAVNGRSTVIAFTTVLIGSVLGFLKYNFYPATIFMGDCGSLFLGFTLGALAMVMDYTRHNALGFAAPVMILGVPIADAFYVTVLRTAKGSKFYIGSKDHFPLRLRKVLGGSTRKAVLAVYSIAVILGALGLASIWMGPWTSLAVYSASLLVFSLMLASLAKVPMNHDGQAGGA